MEDPPSRGSCVPSRGHRRGVARISHYRHHENTFHLRRRPRGVCGAFHGRRTFSGVHARAPHLRSNLREGVKFKMDQHATHVLARLRVGTVAFLEYPLRIRV